MKLLQAILIKVIFDARISHVSIAGISWIICGSFGSLNNGEHSQSKSAYDSFQKPMAPMPTSLKDIFKPVTLFGSFPFKERAFQCCEATWQNPFTPDP